MKRKIRLTENTLHRIIKESVKKVLNEVSTDTLHNAYQKTRNLTYHMPPVTDDPEEAERWRQKRTFGDELAKRHGNEISAIDPMTKRGFPADFDEHPELRNTKAYKIAYKYADGFDWFGDSDDINLSWRDVRDLASDAAYDTKLPASVLQQAMVDYLSNEYGYELE